MLSAQTFHNNNIHLLPKIQLSKTFFKFFHFLFYLLNIFIVWGFFHACRLVDITKWFSRIVDFIILKKVLKDLMNICILIKLLLMIMFLNLFTIEYKTDIKLYANKLSGIKVNISYKICIQKHSIIVLLGLVVPTRTCFQDGARFEIW